MLNNLVKQSPLPCPRLVENRGWLYYQRLIVPQGDGSTPRRPLGRPWVVAKSEQLVVRMAAETRTGGSRRSQGTLTNLGPSLEAITVRHIR